MKLMIALLVLYGLLSSCKPVGADYNNPMSEHDKALYTQDSLKFYKLIFEKDSILTMLETENSDSLITFDTFEMKRQLVDIEDQISYLRDKWNGSLK